MGRRLREFRVAQGMRQEDIADAARYYGFNWGRSSVAALEAGNRDLDFSEILLLPKIVRRLGGWDESLLSGQTIALSETLSVSSSEMLRMMLDLFEPLTDPSQSDDDELVLGAISNEQRDLDVDIKREVAREVLLYDQILFQLWPNYKIGPGWRDYSGGEIVRTIAGRLEVPGGGEPNTSLVRSFSLGMWGHLPGEERDTRANERGPYESKRALQSARGHVTRELIDELQHEIDKRWPEVKEIEAELEALIDDDQALRKWSDKIHALEMKARKRGVLGVVRRRHK